MLSVVFSFVLSGYSKVSIDPIGGAFIVMATTLLAEVALGIRQSSKNGFGKAAFILLVQSLIASTVGSLIFIILSTLVAVHFEGVSWSSVATFFVEEAKLIGIMLAVFFGLNWFLSLVGYAEGYRLGVRPKQN